MISLLPPNATAQERAIEAAMIRAFDVDVPIADLWNPATCPPAFLPWLAWGLSLNIWNPDWNEAEKREAIASAIPDQRILGTRAAVQAVLQRWDDLIGLVEWWEANPRREPGTFHLELPLPADSAVVYDDALVTALLRDIAAVKPLSAHLDALFSIRAATAAFIAVGGRFATFDRLEMVADEGTGLDWANFLQTELGEPILSEAGEFLEEV